LQQQPGVREAVVLAREGERAMRAQPHESREKRLVAYVVGENGSLDAGQLREHLSRSLPDYMLPVAYVQLDRLPLTANGKLDRRALPAPEGMAFAQREYEEPQGELERSLAQIWSVLLRVDRVGRHDNFFELGGHSLLIVQMIERLRQLGLQAEVSAIYDAPTLEALAEQTQPLNPLVSKHVTAIRSGGSRRPLFLVHETSGEVLSYERLSRYLGEGLPLYGLRADRGDAEGLVTIETLAERYVSVIRSVRPEGPYRLAGWSLGGVIAYEMARQLLNEGESVEFLGLIDSRAMNASSLSELLTEEEVKWRLLREVLRSLQPNLEESRSSELSLLGSVDMAIDHCQQAGWLPPGSTQELLWRYRRTWNLYMAFVKYRPQRLPIPVYLYSADIPDCADPSQGWQAVAGDDLWIERIGGTHMSIMEEPHVCKLAESLAHTLADIEQGSLRQSLERKVAVTT
jgi:thioesterase domain-containing protein/aryl carrier-like protein